MCVAESLLIQYTGSCNNRRHCPPTECQRSGILLSLCPWGRSLFSPPRQSFLPASPRSPLSSISCIPCAGSWGRIHRECDVPGHSPGPPTGSDCVLHKCTHTYIHTSHTYRHTYIHTHTHTHTHIRTNTHTHTHIRTYVHTYTHTYVRTHTHIHTYIHTHTHLHTHTYVHVCHKVIIVSTVHCTCTPHYIICVCSYTQREQDLLTYTYTTV